MEDFGGQELELQWVVCSFWASHLLFIKDTIHRSAYRSLSSLPTSRGFVFTTARVYFGPHIHQISPVCLSKSNPGPCQSSGGPLVALCDLLGEPWWWIRAAKPRRVRTTCPESGPGRLNGCMDRLNRFTKFTRFPSQKIWGFVGIFYMKPQFPTLKKIEIERESPSKS